MAAHGRQQRAVEHGEPQLIRLDPDPGGDEREERDCHQHPANPAHRVQRESETRGRLEILGLAVERAAAVADDKLPRLELAMPLAARA